MVIGIISDTHGLLRPEAVRALRGVRLILHAGDVGAPGILDELRRIAPVTAVRGNVDRGRWADGLSDTAVVEVGGHLLYLIHDLSRLDLRPSDAGIAAVIYGHSHVPARQKRHGVVYFNPGSAGPRRFKLPVSLARLHITRDRLSFRLLNLL